MCGDFNIDITNNDHKNKGKFAYTLKDYGYECIYHINNKELMRNVNQLYTWEKVEQIKNFMWIIYLLNPN